MLHIIWVILKFTGIFLAVVLLLLLLLCLILLFVPLRYEFWGKRFPQVLEGSVKISWIMHLAGFWLSFENGTLEAGIRFLCFSKQLIPAQTPRKKEKEKKASGKNRPEEISKKAPEESAEGEGSFWDEGSQTESPAEPYKEKEPEFLKEEESQTQKEPCFLQRLLAGIQRTLTGLVELPGKLQKRLAAWRRGVRSTKRKLTEWVQLLTGDLVKGLFRRYQGFLLCLLKHIRPRRARGSLHFGFEDPGLTGISAGILYLALPAGCGRVEILPDFKECVLEGELSLKGHIRFCHLAWIGWKIFRDKELRTLIKRVRA